MAKPQRFVELIDKLHNWLGTRPSIRVSANAPVLQHNVSVTKQENNMTTIHTSHKTRTIYFYKYFKWNGRGAHHVQTEVGGQVPCGFSSKLYDGSQEKYSYDGIEYNIVHNPAHHKAHLPLNGMPITCKKCLKWLEDRFPE